MGKYLATNAQTKLVVPDKLIRMMELHALLEKNLIIILAKRFNNPKSKSQADLLFLYKVAALFNSLTSDFGHRMLTSVVLDPLFTIQPNSTTLLGGGVDNDPSQNITEEDANAISAYINNGINNSKIELIIKKIATKLVMFQINLPDAKPVSHKDPSFNATSAARVSHSMPSNVLSNVLLSPSGTPPPLGGRRHIRHRKQNRKTHCVKRLSHKKRIRCTRRRH